MAFHSLQHGGGNKRPQTLQRIADPTEATTYPKRKDAPNLDWFKSELFLTLFQAASSPGNVTLYC